MRLRPDSAAGDRVRASSLFEERGAAAEATVFADALRRLEDPRHRACLRWFVLALANEH